MKQLGITFVLVLLSSSLVIPMGSLPVFAVVGSSTSISSSQNPSTFGQSVTFTAMVSPNNATGTVQFLANGTNLGSPITLSGGQATFTTSSLPTGYDNMTASYSGDTTLAVSKVSVFQTVHTVPTSITISSSQNPSTTGQSVTFTATISSPTATGTVRFNDTSTNPSIMLGTAALSGSKSTFTTNSLPAGAHDIIVNYLGDTNDAPSTSTLLVQTVNPASASPTTTLLSSSLTSITFGQSVTFTAMVSPNNATGTVQFLANGTNLGSPVTLSGGQATFTTSSIPAGSDHVVASYLGNNNFVPSASNSVTIIVMASGSSGGQPGNGTLYSTTNLGQLVSDFVHQRNDLKKELRNQTITIIHECKSQVKNASPEDRKQIEEQCKIKLQGATQNFKNLQNQLKQQFEQLKVQFQSKVKQLHQPENLEKKNMTQNFNNPISSLQGNITSHSYNHHGQKKISHGNGSEKDRGHNLQNKIHDED